MAKPQTAAAVIDSLKHYMLLKKWWVEVALLMPDHLHAFISFAPDQRMKEVVKAWKRYLARTQKINWQDGFFDHRLRTDKSANEKWHYILNNPMVDGLVSDPKDWPYIYRIGDSPQGPDLSL